MPPEIEIDFVWVDDVAVPVEELQHPGQSRRVRLAACFRASREGKKPKGYITKAFVSPNADTPMAIHITRVDAGSGESGWGLDALRARYGTD